MSSTTYALPDAATAQRVWLQYRISRLIVIEPTTGCWLWVGDTDNGYGRISVDGRTVRAHRLAYELWRGPIPLGDDGQRLDLDHQCHNEDETCTPGPKCWHRRCVNPGHLEPAKHRDNLFASSRSVTSIHAAKTHCPQGHRYPMRSQAGQKRKCPKCHTWRESARQWNQRHPEQPRSLTPPRLDEPEP